MATALGCAGKEELHEVDNVLASPAQRRHFDAYEANSRVASLKFNVQGRDLGSVIAEAQKVVRHGSAISSCAPRSPMPSST